MSQSRKYRGYDTEKLVSRYLKQWWPFALPTGAGRSGSDVTGVPYIDFEVKARADFQPKQWIDQTEKRTTATGDLPVVVYADLMDKRQTWETIWRSLGSPIWSICWLKRVTPSMPKRSRIRIFLDA